MEIRPYLDLLIETDECLILSFSFKYESVSALLLLIFIFNLCYTLVWQN